MEGMAFPGGASDRRIEREWQRRLKQRNDND